MESNKENTKRSILKSRIPVPLEPLPCISKETLNKKNMVTERRPLEVLLDQTSNLPTHSQNVVIKKEHKKYKLRKSKSFTPNTRHVTKRSEKNDNLDWDFKVFKDAGNSSVIVISDDEEIENSRESDNVKITNKKGLKRSSEFRAQSEAKGFEGDGKHKRRLIFAERLQGLVKSPDPFNKLYADSFIRDYGFDTLSYLVTREDKWSKHSIIPTATRACILNWLLKVNGVAGNPAVIHTATWYLDSILAIGPVAIENLQLFASACFWIAQKIHGPVTSAKKLVRCSNNAFTAQHLLKAEALILFKMNLPAQPVLPQEFISFFSWWCDDENPGEIELAATFICMSGLILEMNCLGEYPSVMGAAAVRNALYLLKKFKLLQKLQSCPVFTAIEKKSNFQKACVIQRQAVLRLSSPLYEYKAPLELFSIGPCNIPEKILQEAIFLSLMESNSSNDKQIES